MRFSKYWDVPVLSQIIGINQSFLRGYSEIKKLTCQYPTGALCEDELAEAVMGTVMRILYFAYKIDKSERYHQAVTDWEVQEYLPLF
jgi:hypothetical protein